MKTNKTPLSEKFIIDKEVPRVYYNHEDVTQAIKDLKGKNNKNIWTNGNDMEMLTIELKELEKIFGSFDEN